MPKFENTFENLKEMNLRLNNTVVVYDGAPYYVLCITDHKADGIFRMYLDEIGRKEGMAHHNVQVPYEWYDEPSMSKGQMMDDWLEKNPDKGVIRKMANSPKFNRFRPFPLGMCNNRGEVVYTERTPVRYTQQGLISSMMSYSVLSAIGGHMPIKKGSVPNILSYEFAQTVKGEYPHPLECIKNLADPDISNTGMAFDRNFAFIRGPIGLLFLAYKSDIVGYMPNGDLSRVTLAQEHKHTKEVVQSLNLFEDIRG